MYYVRKNTKPAIVHIGITEGFAAPNVAYYYMPEGSITFTTDTMDLYIMSSGAWTK